MLRIYSDVDDISFISSQLKNWKIEFSFAGNEFNPNNDLKENEYFIFNLSSVNSELFKSVMHINRIYANNCFFVLSGEKNILHDIIFRLNFPHVFVLPEDKGKFEFALKDSGIFEHWHEDQSAQMSFDAGNRILGKSKKIKEVIALAEIAAKNPDFNVLILGESGTGKGLVAEVIHKMSAFNTSPFVEVSCNSMNEKILEEELFGKEKEAAGASGKSRFTLFEFADKGTIFLDEIGDLNADMQARLSFFAEKKILRKNNSSVDIPLQLRLITSSVKNLDNLAGQKKFRSDLLNRLNSIRIEVPPLRERKEDILMIAEMFIENYSKTYNKKPKAIDDKLKALFMKYPWPGNVRELKAAVERAVLLSHTASFTGEDFRFIDKYFDEENKNKIPNDRVVTLSLDFTNTNLDDIAKRYAKEMLAKNLGNKKKTAEMLSISRPKLDKLLKEEENDNINSE